MELRDAREERPRYKAELEFPEFVDAAPDISEINSLERAVAVTRLQEFRDWQFRDFDPTEPEFSSFPSSLNSSYAVLCCSDLVISVRHRIFHYGPGAAHPNHWTAVSNYQRDPVRQVGLGDLFSRDSAYLDVLSAHCVAVLVEQKQLSEPSSEILSGAEPETKNFRKFNITPEGLVINLEEYQVGAYIEGEFTVFVPTSVLRDILRPKAAVTRFLVSCN